MIQVIRILKNDYIEHLREVLYTTFKKQGIGFEIEFFLGEDEGHNNFVCISISSTEVGIVYRKAMRIYPEETIKEIEDEFIEMLRDNLTTLGIQFMTDNIIKLPFALKPNGKVERFTINLN